MQKGAASVGSPIGRYPAKLEYSGLTEGPDLEGNDMKIVRRISIVLASVAVSIGVIGMTSPSAHADLTWGYSLHK